MLVEDKEEHYTSFKKNTEISYPITIVMFPCKTMRQICFQTINIDRTFRHESILKFL